MRMDHEDMRSTRAIRLLALAGVIAHMVTLALPIPGS